MESMEDELAKAFAEALRTGEIASSSTVSPAPPPPSAAEASSARSKPVTMPSLQSVRDFGTVGQQIAEDARGENLARKKRRHAHKTTCAHCGKKAEKGAKLSTYSRCKYVQLTYDASPLTDGYLMEGRELVRLSSVRYPISQAPDVWTAALRLVRKLTTIASTSRTA
jgi:hypothetical protein